MDMTPGSLWGRPARGKYTESKNGCSKNRTRLYIIQLSRNDLDVLYSRPGAHAENRIINAKCHLCQIMFGKLPSLLTWSHFTTSNNQEINKHIVHLENNLQISHTLNVIIYIYIYIRCITSSSNSVACSFARSLTHSFTHSHIRPKAITLNRYLGLLDIILNCMGKYWWHPPWYYIWANEI